MTSQQRILFHRALIPASLVTKYGEPSWSISTEEKPIYTYDDTPTPKIMLGACSEPTVEHHLGQHEYGHYLHYKSQKLIKGRTDLGFLRVMQHAAAKLPLQSTDFVQTAYNWGVELNNPLENEQFGCLFDMIGALTLGKAGGGHTTAYYNEGNNAAMEVFAHSYTTCVCGNPYIAKYFPVLVAWLRREYQLPNLGMWHTKHPEMVLYQMQKKESYPTRELPSL